MLGAAVGAIVGASLYIISETQQSDGFDLRSDWVDLAAATGMGAVAGGLIMTPGATSVGIAMAGALVVDHAVDIGTSQNFLAVEHIETGGIAAVTGVVTGGLPISNSASILEAMTIKGMVAASIVGGYGMWKRRLGLMEDTDPVGDMIDMASAGASESAGTGISHALKSEAAGELASAGIELTTKIIVGNRNRVVAAPVISPNRHSRAIMRKLERMEQEWR